jgi:hypothetical protein
MKSFEFPTEPHRSAAEAEQEHFLNIQAIDTLLIVSFSAGAQVAESDLDLAIWATTATSHSEMREIFQKRVSYSANIPSVLRFRQSSSFAHIHLDIMDGKHVPGVIKQVEKCLNKPALYPKTPPILSISNIERSEINEKAIMLPELLMKISDE